MDDQSKLTILKADLQMLTTANDDYLKNLLDAVKELIEREGIVLENTVECSLVQIHYAAYLFRKRASGETSMPRFLRYELNNLSVHQKGTPDREAGK